MQLVPVLFFLCGCQGHSETRQKDIVNHSYTVDVSGGRFKFLWPLLQCLGESADVLVSSQLPKPETGHLYESGRNSVEYWLITDQVRKKLLLLLIITFIYFQQLNTSHA